MDTDRFIALELQEQFKQEVEIETGSNLVYKRNNNRDFNNSKSLVDPSWELIDPTPDIYTLFIVFNERYFWGKLATVCVSWSKKMTSCAGICSYQGRGGMCKITLSEPLLKLRPRKDLVETFLHEMIHAYLFVTNNNRDRDGHGPEFHKHMYRINAEAGTNITVYHDFHDEVRLYQQHWWRCNGVCQKWKPYFGIVRRSVNRAPGPNDFWWAEHSKNCGGTFTKVKEPENFKGRKSQKENIKLVTDPKNDIRKYMDSTKVSKPDPTSGVGNSSKIVGFKDLHKKSAVTGIKNSSSTIVTNKTNSYQCPNEEINSNKTVAIIKPFVGEGRSLINTKYETKKDYSVVRNHWLQKFQNQTDPKKDDEAKLNENNKKRTLSLNVPIEKKRQKTTLPTTSLSVSDLPNKDFVNCPVCRKDIENSKINEHLDTCLTEDANVERDLCLICNKTVPKETLNSHVNDCLDRISTDGKVNCDHCKSLIDKNKFSDHYKQCLDNVFVNDSENTKKCNICGEEIATGINFDEHVERCLDDIYDASEPVDAIQEDNNLKESENDTEMVSCLVCGKSTVKSNLEVHLDECMEKIFNKEEDKSNAEEEGECSSSGSSADEKVNCPFCLKFVLESEMINHLNLCFAVE